MACAGVVVVLLRLLRSLLLLLLLDGWGRVWGAFLGCFVWLVGVDGVVGGLFVCVVGNVGVDERNY